jgi:predicted ATPase/DNA-binding winged helix-turn-helix (wHTH) protein
MAFLGRVLHLFTYKGGWLMRTQGEPQSDGSDNLISFGPFTLRLSERLLASVGKPVELGTRALDLLIVLVERAGQVVGKRDLIASVWPDTTVDESNLRFQIASLRKALADGKSGARYVITVPGRGYCFVAPTVRSSPLRLPTAQSLLALRSNGLPPRLTRMVGRDETVQKISAQLAAKRFVSIVGPGGIGKTTVAIEIGHRLLAGYEDGVYFLDLGPLNDPLLVASAVVSALRLPVQSDDPVLSLIGSLRDKRILMIFDNCEHVIETAAALAERIFQAAPEVHILATSREGLRVEGEHVHSLKPLDNPPDDAELTAAQARTFPAVQLFLERVAASGHYLELQDGDAPTVAEICRRLDGIALAIELAAGRVNAYGLRATAALLNDRFRLLWEGRRTALLRHQTLSAALDWSYDLLGERERVILRRLSVFAGAFTLEAARSVAAGTEIDREQVNAAVASLVGKSLISVNTSDLATRYRLLDTTRAYLRKKLDSADAQETARRHAIYHLGLLQSADVNPAPVSTSPDGRSSTTLAEHLGDVRAGLEWSSGERGDITLGSSLAVASAPLFLELSLLTECHRWTERAIATLDQTNRGTRMEMKLQGILGLSLMFARGNSEQVRDALNRSLLIAGELHDLHSELRLLGTLFIFHGRIGEFHRATEVALRSAAVAEKIADPVGIAEAHTAVGIARHVEGDVNAARFHLESAIEIPVSNHLETLFFGFEFRYFARIVHARALWLAGLADQATTAARNILEEVQTVDHPVTRCVSLIWGIPIFLWNGDFDSAEHYIDTVIKQTDKYSLAPYHAVGHALRGELMVKRGEAESGVMVLRDSLDTLHELRYELSTIALTAAIAEGLATLGQLGAALKTIDEIISLAERNAPQLAMPELLRVKGNILVSTPGSDPSKAEEYLLSSLDLAGRQGALAWELRAATSLASLLSRQGRPEEGRKVIATVYDRFSEGFDNSDLKAAARLMRDLGRPFRTS